MFSLIRRLLRKAISFDALSERVTHLENTIARLEKIADENDSLWQFLDEQEEMEGVFMGSAEEFEEEFTDILIRNMKPRGDA